MTRYLKALLRAGPARQALAARLWPETGGAVRLSEDNALVAVPVRDGRAAMKHPRLDDPERV